MIYIYINTFPTYTSVSHIIERKGTRPQKTFPLRSFSQAPRKPYLTALNRILCRNIYQLKIQVEVVCSWNMGDCKTEAAVFFEPRASFQVIFVARVPLFLQPKKKPSGRQGSGEGGHVTGALRGVHLGMIWQRAKQLGKRDIKICPSEFWIVNMVIDSQNLQIQYV